MTDATREERDTQRNKDIRSLECEFQDARRAEEQQQVGTVLAEVLAALSNAWYDAPSRAAAMRFTSGMPRLALSTGYGLPALDIRVGLDVFQLRIERQQSEDAPSPREMAEQAYAQGKRPKRDREW